MNEKEFAVSLALTEHYQTEETLGAYALMIKTGQGMQLDPGVEAQFISEMHSHPGLQKMLSLAKGQPEIQRNPWWKIW